MYFLKVSSNVISLDFMIFNNACSALKASEMLHGLCGLQLILSIVSFIKTVLLQWHMGHHTFALARICTLGWSQSRSCASSVV